MHHAYSTPAGYTQKLNPADIIGTQEANRQPGPDKTQTNIWRSSKSRVRGVGPARTGGPAPQRTQAE